MTPTERAEKILSQLESWVLKLPHRTSLYELIAAQIEEAEREAVTKAVKFNDELVATSREVDRKVVHRMFDEKYAEGFRAGTESHGVEGHMTCTKCVAEGFRTAREKARVIVSETPGNTYTTDCDHDAIAQRIGEMEP